MNTPASPLAQNTAGETGPASVLGHLEFTDRLIEMVAGARQEIVIGSVDLDRRIYGGDVLVGGLRRFLLEHRRGRLRGLVQKPKLAVRGAHRLVELSRALSSRIELREPGAASSGGGEEYIIVDQRKLLVRTAPGDLEARYYADAPALAREQQRSFEQCWQQAQIAREFAELRL